MHSKFPKSKTVPKSLITTCCPPVLSHVPATLAPQLSTFSIQKVDSCFLCPLNQMIPKAQPIPSANWSPLRHTTVGQIALWFIFINIMNITVKFFTLALSSSSNKKWMTSTKTSSVTATGKPFSENVVNLPQLGVEVNECSSLDL